MTEQIFHCVDIQHFVCLLGTLGCFPLWAIVSAAVVNIAVQAFVFSTSRYLPPSEMLGHMVAGETVEKLPGSFPQRL
jgi:hypothetical protein